MLSAATLGTGLAVLGTWLIMNAEEHTPAPSHTAQTAPSGDSFRKETHWQADTSKPSQQSYPYFQKLETLLNAASKETDPDLREGLLAAATTLMLEKNPAPALKFLARVSPPELQEDLQARLLHDWAEKAPHEALDAVLGMGSGPYARSLAIVYETWADQDVTAAVASLDGLPSEHVRQCAGMAIAGESIRTDPNQALQLVVGLPQSPERDSLLVRASAEWANHAPDEAVAWTQGIEDKDLRMTITAGIATTMGETDPNAAAELALKTLQSGKLLDDTVVAILQRWAQTDPQAAAAWLEKFPEGQLREDAMSSFVKIWSAKDPDSSDRWIAATSVKSK